jgi:hypothetical protein
LEILNFTFRLEPYMGLWGWFYLIFGVVLFIRNVVLSQIILDKTGE